jgi:hypothetical protein
MFMEVKHGRRFGADTHTKHCSEDNCQVASRQGKKPYEFRPDWSIAYPSPKVPGSWIGVTRLSQTDELYWLIVSRFQDKSTDIGHYSLRVSLKDGPRSKPSVAQLLPAPNCNCFVGIVFLDGQKYRAWLAEDGPYLRLRFEEIISKEEGK